VNRKQLVVLWIGLAVMVGMVLYPPWVPTAEVYRAVGERVRYCPIWIDPIRIGQEWVVVRTGYEDGNWFNYWGWRDPSGKIPYGSMNYRRLALQVAVVGGIAGCLIVTFRRKQ